MAIITPTEEYTDSTECAIEIAEANGFTIVRPTARQLLLDLDRPYDPLEFDRRLQRLRETNPKLRPCVTDAWDSKDGGRHVVVTVACKLTPPERLLLELTLGSDPVRGMHGFRHWRDDDAEQPESILFRPPKVVKKPIELSDDDVPF